MLPSSLNNSQLPTIPISSTHCDSAALSNAIWEQGALGFFVAATENGGEKLLMRAVTVTRHGSDGARRDDALGCALHPSSTSSPG